MIGLQAFIYQEGLVDTRMQEAYVWTWLCFLFNMCYNLNLIGTMFFRFLGEPYFYGSRVNLALIFYVSIFPLVLGHDPVTCSTIFKEAAGHFGYPGMMNLHRGYWLHVTVDVLTAIAVFILWLLFCSPTSFYAQYSFDFYFLYLEGGMAFLLQLYLFPVYARIATKLRTKITPTVTDSTTPGGKALLRTKSVSHTQPAVKFASATPDRSERVLKIRIDEPPSKSAVGFSSGFSDVTDRGTSATAGKASVMQSWGDRSAGEISAVFGVAKSPDPRAVPSSQIFASSSANDILAVDFISEGRHGSGSLPQAQSIKKAASGTWPTLIPRLSRKASEISIESGSRSNFLSPVLNISKRFRRMDSGASSVSTTSSLTFRKLQPSASFLRQTEGNFFQALQMSLQKLPQGLPALAKNVSRSVGILVRHWRFMAACRPEKFTFAAGVILPSLFLWPVWEITVPYNNVAVAIMVSVPKAIAILIGLLVAVYLISASSRCSEAMILAAAAAKQGIGSGLVYSTASILNALLTGAPLEAGTVATEDRIREAAAVSCRWDVSCCWTLLVQEGNSTRECSIMIPRVQLFRAALEARRRGCRWFWMDTLSIPQSSEKDSREVRAQKAAVCQRLITTMTSVYACCKRVIVVETQSGTSLFETDHYSCRTWTLQECVLNRNLSEVPLTGEVEDLPDVESRAHLAGTTEADTWVVDNNLSNLETYEWVLRGRVTAASSKVSAGKAAEYLRFVERRHGACAADKAVALGQIFFKLLFENPDVSSQFMQELACTLAETQADGLGASPEPLLLIDNSNWDSATMTGSASMPRFLAGKPGSIQEGKSVTWTVLRLPDSSPVEALKEDVEDRRGTLKVVAGGQRSGEWWICWMALRSRIIPVAIEHTRIQRGAHRGKSLLLKLRTCTVEEKQALEHNNRSLIETQIQWM